MANKIPEHWGTVRITPILWIHELHLYARPIKLLAKVWGACDMTIMVRNLVRIGKFASVADVAVLAPGSLPNSLARTHLASGRAGDPSTAVRSVRLLPSWGCEMGFD